MRTSAKFCKNIYELGFHIAYNRYVGSQVSIYIRFQRANLVFYNLSLRRYDHTLLFFYIFNGMPFHYIKVENNPLINNGNI